VVGVSDRILPERRCPICGAPNVNPHPNSFCPQHHPVEDLDVTSLDNAETAEPAHEEARDVAGHEPFATPDRDVLPAGGRSRLRGMIECKSEEDGLKTGQST
jgi:hypothetical protein